jgi:ubiquinone biosynthesis protein
VRILELARTYRNLRRLKDIVLVLTRHGFGQLVERIDLGRYVPLLKRIAGKAAGPEELPTPAPERLVRVIEELGPTFVKFGQLMATRPDIVPEEYVEALAELQDKVGPFSSVAARAIIDRELGRPLAEVFSSFEDKPVASGSLAQVHAAELVGGGSVAVKVKRPGAEKTAVADLDLLAAIAELAEKHVPELAHFRPTMIVEEFGRALRRELNFTTEASTLVKFGKFFEDDPSVKIPAVHWDYSTPSLLVMERIAGRPLTDIDALRDSDCDLKQLAEKLCNAFLRQFFEFGTFHADPHPGNILVLEGARPALLDFGMVGHISGELKSQLATTLLALVRGDMELIVSVYTDIGVFSEGADLAAVRLDLLEFLDRYYGVPARTIDMSQAFYDVLHVARRHEVELPRDFVMLGRAFVLMSALVRKLYPDVDIASAIKPYAKKLLLERFSPRHLLKRAGASLYYLTSFLNALPRDLRQLMKKAQTGRLTLTFRHEGLENLVREMDRSSNRLAFAMIIAAVIVGSSLMIAQKLEPLVPGTDLSVIGLVGYVVAGFLGMGLAWAIYRSGKL